MEQTKSSSTGGGGVEKNEDHASNEREHLATWMSRMAVADGENDGGEPQQDLNCVDYLLHGLNDSDVESNVDEAEPNGSPQLNASSQASLDSLANLNSVADASVILSICRERIELVANLVRVQDIGNALSPALRRKLCRLSKMDLDNERAKVMKVCVAIGSRIVSDFILKHSDCHHMAANLWHAVRQRGCQFLGPAIQDEIIRLVLLAMEDGAQLTRKVLLMYLVQRLNPFYPTVSSKTAVGHVVQILYRASCFDIIKIEQQSSLMSLKSEFTNYEALRREHDAQLVLIGLEAGLRITPEQWSSILYGDSEHRHRMQSIVDKLQKVKPSFDLLLEKLKAIVYSKNDPNEIGDVMVYFEQLAYMENCMDDEEFLTVENIAIAMDAVNFITIKFLTLFRALQKRESSTTNSTPKKTFTALHQKLSA